MKCYFPKCNNEATHKVCRQHKGKELNIDHICEKEIKFYEKLNESVNFEVFLIIDDIDSQPDKPLADFMFRRGRRGDKGDPYGWYYLPIEDAIFLPCKVHSDYKEDFKFYLFYLIHVVIHETLHGILNDFIDPEACACLDSWMCMDFEGYVDEKINDESIYTYTPKYLAMVREKIIVNRIAEKVKLNKRLSKKDYHYVSQYPYVSKKYWEAKRKYYEAKYGKL